MVHQWFNLIVVEFYLKAYLNACRVTWPPWMSIYSTRTYLLTYCPGFFCLFVCFSFSFLLTSFFFKFYFIFKLYIIVSVLPNIKMNPPQVYMCSPFLDGDRWGSRRTCGFRNTAVAI